MIKRTITYTDFNDEQQTEEWHFHLSQAEALELEASEKDGLSELLKQIIAEKDMKKLFSIFKTLLKTAAGKRSDDGKRFHKSPEILDEFVGTGACDQLVFDLLSDPTGAPGFFDGFLPKNMQSPEGAKFKLPPAEVGLSPAEKTRMKIALDELQTMDEAKFRAMDNGTYREGNLY